ncbi:hypothetical protein [Lysobacter gummosus]|uniref:hypothetical protein n=1 Tax=Lysobacter gummosus TaxID=262324 RepID=UPI0036448294
MFSASFGRSGRAWPACIRLAARAIGGDSKLHNPNAAALRAQTGYGLMPAQRRGVAATHVRDFRGTPCITFCTGSRWPRSWSRRWPAAAARPSRAAPPRP